MKNLNLIKFMICLLATTHMINNSLSAETDENISENQRRVSSKNNQQQMLNDEDGENRNKNTKRKSKKKKTNKQQTNSGSSQFVAENPTTDQQIEDEEIQNSSNKNTKKSSKKKSKKKQKSQNSANEQQGEQNKVDATIDNAIETLKDDIDNLDEHMQKSLRSKFQKASNNDITADKSVYVDALNSLYSNIGKQKFEAFIAKASQSSTVRHDLNNLGASLKSKNKAMWNIIKKYINQAAEQDKQEDE